MRNVHVSPPNHAPGKYYNFLIIKATSQKAHHARKKA
jgi:hypothetical protein